LNIDELKVVDGKLNGFDDQLKTLKESDAYLFEIDNNNQDPQPRLDKFGKEIKGDNLNAGDMDAEAIASKYGFGKKEN
jgi:hypothetical protein